MTVTIIKQLSLQPKDTFETLRHRFSSGEKIDFDATRELVYFARREGITLSGSTSFVATAHHQPFMRQVDTEVSHQRKYIYTDYSPRSTDLSRGIRVQVHEYPDEQTNQMHPFDHARAAAVDGLLREQLGHQRAVNRHFESMVRAAETKIIDQWLAGHSEAKRPLIHRACLHVPVIDYLQAMDVIGDMFVMSAYQARRTVGDSAFSGYTPISRPTLGKVTFEIEPTETADLRAGDVVQTYLGDFSIESSEHLQGSAGRECTVLRGRYLLDDGPEMLVSVPGVSGGYRVLNRY